MDFAGSMCTGVLVRPDVVLTAAHCVSDNLTHALRAPEGAVFRAGYHRGQAIATRRVTHIAAPTAYQSAALEGLTDTTIALDVALLRLDFPLLDQEARPFPLHEAPFEGTKVSLVSYGKGRSEMLTREPDCAVTGRFRGGVLGFDCDATFGSSGAPIFIRADGRYHILSLVSSIGVTETDDFQVYGMVLPRLVSTLMRQLGKERPQPTVSRGIERLGAGERTRSTGGAKFIRPRANGS